MPARKNVTSVAEHPPIDPACPPIRVRRKRDGMVLPWSTLFRRKAAEFEPYYRPGTDDALKHAHAVRKYKLKRFGEDAIMPNTFGAVGTNQQTDDFAGGIIDGELAE